MRLDRYIPEETIYIIIMGIVSMIIGTFATKMQKKNRPGATLKTKIKPEKVTTHTKERKLECSINMKWSKKMETKR